MKKILLIVIALAYITCNAYTQNVKGRIVNPEGDALSAATIKVLHQDTIPTIYFITNDKGGFNERVPYPEYTLIISFMGYENISIKVARQERGTIDLGDIVLQPKDHVLDEVQVDASPLVEKADRIIAFPNARQVKHSSNSFELLELMNLPGLFVDNIQEKVSILGTSGVIYKINHVPASYDQVAALRSNEILRVEYHQSPSAREIDSNSGVINFILKDNKVGTFLSTDVTSAVSTGLITGRMNGKTIGEKSLFSAGYKIAYRNYDNRCTDQVYQYAFPEGDIEEKIQGKGNPFGYRTLTLNLGYTYHDKKNTFDMQFSNQFNRSFSDDLFHITRNPYSTESRRTSHGDAKSYSPSLHTYYIRTVDKDRTLEATIMGKLAYNDSDARLVETGENRLPDVVIRSSSEIRKSVIGELFYNDSRNKYFGFNFGTRVSTSNTTNKFNGIKTRFDKRELFAYAELQGACGGFSYQLFTSLLVNHLDMNHTSRSTDVNNISALRLRYGTERWSVLNFMTYNTSSPSLSLLTDNYQRQDPLLVWKGNPDLDPSRKYLNQMVGSVNISPKIRWEAMVKYSKTLDPIVTRYRYDRELTSILSQPFNAKYDQCLEGYSGIHCNSILDRISVRLGVQYYDYLTKGQDYRHTLNYFQWFVNANVLYKDFTLLASYAKPLKSLSGEYIQQDENSSSVSLRYKKKQLAIELGMYYFLQDGAIYRRQSLSAAYRYDAHTLIKDNTNMVFVKFSYSISSGKSPFRVRKTIQVEDNETSIRE